MLKTADFHPYNLISLPLIWWQLREYEQLHDQKHDESTKNKRIATLDQLFRSHKASRTRNKYTVCEQMTPLRRDPKVRLNRRVANSSAEQFFRKHEFVNFQVICFLYLGL